MNVYKLDYKKITLKFLTLILFLFMFSCDKPVPIISESNLEKIHSVLEGVWLTTGEKTEWHKNRYDIIKYHFFKENDTLKFTSQVINKKDGRNYYDEKNSRVVESFKTVIGLERAGYVNITMQGEDVRYYDDSGRKEKVVYTPKINLNYYSKAPFTDSALSYVKSGSITNFKIPINVEFHNDTIGYEKDLTALADRLDQYSHVEKMLLAMSDFDKIEYRDDDRWSYSFIFNQLYSNDDGQGYTTFEIASKFSKPRENIYAWDNQLSYYYKYENDFEEIVLKVSVPKNEYEKHKLDFYKVYWPGITSYNKDYDYSEIKLTKVNY